MSSAGKDCNELFIALYYAPCPLPCGCSQRQRKLQKCRQME
jgi:hypothetical protein